MEEQFILRVPPSVAERIDRLLSENASSSEEKSLDVSFTGNADCLFFLWHRIWESGVSTTYAGITCKALAFPNQLIQ